METKTYRKVKGKLVVDLSTPATTVQCATVEPEPLYKVIKVFAKSARRQVLERNLTKEQAMRVVNSFPDSSTSMVVFTKQ